MDSLPQIPQDLWPTIASFMDDKTKRQMRLANTTWFKIIRYNKFNIYFARPENIQAISERLSKYSWPIELCFVKSKVNTVQDILDHISMLTNLTKISEKCSTINGEVPFARDYALAPHLSPWTNLLTLTNIQSWQLCERYVPYNIWPTFEKLKELTVSFPERCMDMYLEQLTNLDSLNFSDRWRAYPLVLNPSLGYSLSRITKLVVPSGGLNKDSICWSHLTNLKVLSYVFCNFVTKDVILIDLSYLTALEHLRLRTNGILPSLAMNTNLTELSIRFRTANTQLVDELTKLTKLRKLDMDRENRHDFDTLNQSFSFLAHLQQLEDLAISNKLNNDELICPHLPNSLNSLNIEIDHLDIAQLTHLTNLQKLSTFGDSCSVNIQYMTALPTLTYLSFNYSVEQDLVILGKLTQLRELLIQDKMAGDSINNVPNLLELVNLTALQWEASAFPSIILEQWMYLAGLRELRLISDPDLDDAGITSCNSLSKLINLTFLIMYTKVHDHDSIWHGMEKLTKLQDIELHSADNDDRLLSLTAMKDLTSLCIGEFHENFTGRHLTALTNLQCLPFRIAPSKFAHTVDNLMNKMPYLWYTPKSYEEFLRSRGIGEYEDQ